LGEKSEARKSKVRWKRVNTYKRAPVMEKEERTGKGTTLRKKRNHKRERKGKIRGGRGREKQELPPSHGRGNKRPPAGQPSAGHRRRRMSGARQKAAAFRRAARPTGNFQKSCFFYSFSTANHHPAFRLEIAEQSHDVCVVFQISSFSKNPLQTRNSAKRLRNML
jgi:hypothetical protein